MVQPGLCWPWSETLKTGFLATRLICTYNGLPGFVFSSVAFDVGPMLPGFNWDMDDVGYKQERKVLLILQIITLQKVLIYSLFIDKTSLYF